MNRRSGAEKDQSIAVLLLSTVFLLGGILGAVLGMYLPVCDMISQLFAENGAFSSSPPVWRELLIVFRWPFLVLTGGMISTAYLLIPFLFFLRGCLLSYGISVVIWSGIPSAVFKAVLAFAPACALALPVFFLLGVECLTRRITGKPISRILRLLICCIPFLLVCMALDCLVVPAVLQQIGMVV